MKGLNKVWVQNINWILSTHVVWFTKIIAKVFHLKNICKVLEWKLKYYILLHVSSLLKPIFLMVSVYTHTSRLLVPTKSYPAEGVW